MALGKNLPKQQLIPTEKAEGSSHGSKKRKTPASKKKTVKVTKKTPVVEKGNAIESEELVIENSGNRIASITTKRYLSKAEYQRRQELKKKFDGQLSQMRSSRIQVVTFQLGTEEYALQIAKTKEVVVTPSISKLPHTPDHIRGVANVRGQSVVAVDLMMKFGLSVDDAEIPSFMVVMKNDFYQIGLLVDQVPVAQTIEGEKVESASNMFMDTTSDETYIMGLIKLGDRTIFLLDIDELVEGDKVSLSPEAQLV
ncbi:MAG: purine-binding chemotaxis protein CheW [Cyclobacteriaceae bacterium]|nr:purine-binding chemotaxis protein CheW [Cyclobacteriaceae bacterium HetDA_MAG_MS6]